MKIDAEATSRPVEVLVSGLSKTFGSKKAPVRVLDELSLEVTKGEMLVLLGPSGCGKTTLLRCVVGLEQPDTGRIVLGNQTVVDAERGLAVPPNKRGVGMVFQNYALWPHMTIAQNVAFPLKSRGQQAAISEGRVKEVLEIVQCAHLSERFPSQLSGGQQQRVALARALASRPNVMLMDEPLSNLDALLRIDLRAQLHQLHQKFGFTGIYVTHDQVEAISLGTRVVVMKAGRMEQIGPPNEIYSRPANEYVAEFLGMRNALTCTVTDEGKLVCAGATAALPPNYMPAGQYRLRGRPTEMTLRAPVTGGSADGNVAWLKGGRVIDSLRYGESEEYVVGFGNETVLIEVKEGLGIPTGEPVDIGLNLRAIRFYGEGGTLASTRLMA
jgi:iron(III) transport system ATP-binding protein